MLILFVQYFNLLSFLYLLIFLSYEMSPTCIFLCFSVKCVCMLICRALQQCMAPAYAIVIIYKHCYILLTTTKCVDLCSCCVWMWWLFTQLSAVTGKPPSLVTFIHEYSWLLLGMVYMVWAQTRKSHDSYCVNIYSCGFSEK